MSATVQPLHRTLEQELVALLRGASLECPVCGEFVLHVSVEHGGSLVRCPECGMQLEREPSAAESKVEFESQAG
jgi:predicted RNA-binding Zn-ribbon protein involved in translation (DUF1610 family)